MNTNPPNTIPFNASDWTADKRVVTRDGRPARIVHIINPIPDAIKHPVLGYIDGIYATWKSNGAFLAVMCEHKYDLFFQLEQKLRPWKHQEVPVGAQLRCKGYNSRTIIIGVDGKSGEICSWNHNKIIWEMPQVLLDRDEHSIDGGKTWLPCGILE